MAGGANPAMTQAASNPYSQASAAQMGAMATYANPAARAQQMMNPYQQAVVDKTLRDVGSAAQLGMNQLGAQATAAGAYGGSRHGVAMAEAAKGYQQQALDAVGALNQQGYNQAMNDAFRSAQGMQSAGQQSFGYGQQIQNMQMQQGAMQQAAMQQLIDQARNQYQGYANAPTQKMQLPLQALGMVPYSTSQTTSGGAQTSSMNPGLFNYLQVGASMFGGGS